jgi:hypothetical protein
MKFVRIYILTLLICLSPLLFVMPKVGLFLLIPLLLPTLPFLLPLLVVALICRVFDRPR